MSSIDPELVAYLAIGFSAVGSSLLLGSIVTEHKRRRNLSAEPDFIAEPPKLVANSGLGKIERRMKNLSEVVVICNRIEAPTDELLAAVRHNVKRGCKYRFFVSGSLHAEELSKQYLLFKTIADLENGEGDFVRLLPLPYEWKDKPPIVFYRTTSPSGLKTIAYRGFTAGEGIDDMYRLVDPYLGHSILEMLIATAEDPKSEASTEDIRPEEFLPNPKVIQLTQKRKVG